MNALNLKIERMRKGFTQFSLSKKTGISERMIGHFEQGRHLPSEYQISTIAAALDIPVNNLIYDMENN